MAVQRKRKTTTNPTSAATSAPHDARYDAVAARDRSQDGRFVYAVRTTGVACRPSCGARLARRENMEFFGTLPEAIAAGYRACRRCRPELHGDADVHVAVVTAACRLLDAAVAQDAAIPSLDQLATHTGYSPFHLHRLFQRFTGVTPRAYALARRADRAADALSRRRTVSEAIAGAGFSSSSRFYESAAPRLGMRARTSRRGGAGEQIRWVIVPTTMGPLLVAGTATGLCQVAFDGTEASLRARYPAADLRSADAAFIALVGQVVQRVEQPTERLAELPLDIRGTAFQQRVWQALQGIRCGETASYSEVAARLGQPKAVRAVAQACAANALAVVVPCHRVVGADGAVTGYRWGVERKRGLLAREKGSAG